MFVAEITYEFILGLHILLPPGVFVDLGCRMLRLGNVEVPSWRPIPLMRGRSEVVPLWCGAIVAERLKGSLETTDSIEGSGHRSPAKLKR